MVQIKEKVGQILDQEIDRKQFLQYSLAIFLSVFGVTTVIQAILSNDRRMLGTPKLPANKPRSGYGSSRFNQ